MAVLRDSGNKQKAFATPMVLHVTPKRSPRIEGSRKAKAQKE